MSPAAAAPRRLGRPPAASSADTRGRIIEVARRRFADSGYDTTTNREIAAEAGITTGAIYHYFESKRDLYLAVFVEVESRVFGAFREAVVGIDGLVPGLHAVLEAAVAINRQDPSIAGFVVSVPTEARRHPELAELVARQNADAVGFFRALVAEGERGGELVEGVDPAAVVSMLLAVTTGLARFAIIAGDADVHAATTDAFVRLVEGRLFTASGSPPRASAQPRERQPFQ